MCGIAGFQGSFDPELLDDMSRAIRHRGPDDAGTLHLPEDQIGLTHRRLAIIDLSPRGHQPMWDTGTRCVISFNGEIYNYRELRQELLAGGAVFQSRSDTEVLLNLYLADGPAMLTRLNGMFAFAIWDRATHELFLARDAVGVKPLYWTETPKGFLFASELKALLREESVAREIDPVAVRDHLTYLWAPAPRTMLRAVKKLPPGHALLVRAGRVARTWSFYQLPYDQPLEACTSQEAAQQLGEHLQTAVARQMVADVPVGAFLSGGLDSSSVVALAQRNLREGCLQCFTIGFDDPVMAREGLCEDRPYAERVARHLGVDLHTIYVGPEMAAELATMIYYLDEPQADLAPINALFISRLAREHDIKVLLSGAGGDDIFTGYRRHLALTLERTWAWLPRMGRHALRRTLGRLPARNARLRRLAKAFQYADRDAEERLASYFYWIDPALRDNLYSQHLKNQLAAEGTAETLFESLSELGPDVAPLNRMLYLETKHFLADHNLNYTDRMGMAAGVEVRVPLLDPDLISFAARLPLDFKQRGRTGKWIFKRAMEPLLPQDVVYRPKTGFGAPLRHWLHHALRPLVADLLGPTAVRRRGLFDPEAVTDLVSRNQRGSLDAAYPILALICIELWCRIFLDGRGRPPGGA